MPLGVTAAASAADTGIHKLILGSGTTALKTSNDEMKHSDLLLKGVSERIQNEAKNKKKGLLKCY